MEWGSDAVTATAVVVPSGDAAAAGEVKVATVVEAKAGAEDFYRRLGFEALDVLQGAVAQRPEPTPMFLALGSVPRRP